MSTGDAFWDDRRIVIPSEFDSLLRGAEETGALQRRAERARIAVFGRRMRVYAPIYLSNLCVNECLYCGFRLRNRDATRRTITHDELRGEIASVVAAGHSHLLLVSGEVPSIVTESYLLRALAVAAEFPQIRRVDLEIGPLPHSELANLARAGFHTFVLYQETYDRDAYRKWHVFGPKSDYERRRAAVSEALEAGWSGVALGVLLGIAKDWRAELSAMVMHATELQQRFQIVPGFSLPRFRPAEGIAGDIETSAVSDDDFARALACLRLAMPDAEIGLSTRESAALRDALLSSGISSVSAGSKTNPGGYLAAPDSTKQFEIADERSTPEFIRVLLEKGYDPFPFRLAPASRTAQVAW